jgi:hypothetical protein
VLTAPERPLHHRAPRRSHHGLVIATPCRTATAAANASAPGAAGATAPFAPARAHTFPQVPSTAPSGHGRQSPCQVWFNFRTYQVRAAYFRAPHNRAHLPKQLLSRRCSQHHAPHPPQLLPVPRRDPLDFVAAHSTAGASKALALRHIVSTRLTTSCRARMQFYLKIRDKETRSIQNWCLSQRWPEYEITSGGRSRDCGFNSRRQSDQGTVRYVRTRRVVSVTLVRTAVQCVSYCSYRAAQTLCLENAAL